MTELYISSYRRGELDPADPATATPTPPWFVPPPRAPQLVRPGTVANRWCPVDKVGWKVVVREDDALDPGCWMCGRPGSLAKP